MKLDTVRRYALSLPEVVEAPHFDHGSFRLRGGRMICGHRPPGPAGGQAGCRPAAVSQPSFSICRKVESVCCM